MAQAGARAERPENNGRALESRADRTGSSIVSATCSRSAGANLSPATASLPSTAARLPTAAATLRRQYTALPNLSKSGNYRYRVWVRGSEFAVPSRNGGAITGTEVVIR